MSDDWKSWGKHVLTELQDLKKEIKECREEVNKINTSMAVLNVKSGIWGFGAGALPILIWFIKENLK